MTNLKDCFINKPFKIMRYQGLWWVNFLPYNNLVSALIAISKQ